MEKGKVNILLHSITSIILAVILVISTSYAWYTNNKNVSANGGDVLVSSESLDAYRYYVFKEPVVDTPYPKRDPDLPQGLINGESLYLSITIRYAAKDKGNKNLRVILKNIEGGDFFINGETLETYADETEKKYNMCDLFTINFHSSWATNEDSTYTMLKDGTGSLDVPFTRVENENGEQVTFIPELEAYKYIGWDSSVYEEITLVFQMKFNTAILDEVGIPADVAATKNMSFGQIVIIAEDSE